MTEQASMERPPVPSPVGDELPPGTELCNGQYTVEKYLNCGGFGITYLARDSLGRKVVIKECFPNAICCRAGETVRLRSQSYEMDFGRAVDLFQKEAGALARLDHPNIVGVHQIFQANGTAYMALDFIKGLDLLELPARHPAVRSPAAIRELALILLKALAYVHGNGILHRDISPDNILLDMSGMPVLIDFGAARQGATQASRVLSRVYTVKDGYSPQEFYFAGSAQSASSDLYALAATFYHLIEGSAPPNSSARLAAVAEKRPDPYEPLSGRFPAYDEALLASIDRCMNLFAKDRLQSAQAWYDAIEGRVTDLPDTAAPAEPPAALIDTEVTRRICELVEENHKAISERGVAPPPVPRADLARQKADEDRRAAEREYWAILNEDPATWDEAPDPEAATDTGADPLDEEPAPPAPKRGFSLWSLVAWLTPKPRRGIEHNI